MREPYGYAGKRRFCALAVMRTAGFASALALTLEARSVFAVSSATLDQGTALWLSLIAAASVGWLWLSSDTLLAWTIRVDVLFAVWMQRGLAAILLSFVATAVPLCWSLTGAPRSAAVPYLFNLLIGVEGIATAFSAVVLLVGAYFIRQHHLQLKVLRQRLVTFKEKYPRGLGRIEQYVEQETSAVNPGMLVRGRSFPGLTSKAWHDPAHFPWISSLEEAFETIRDELLAAVEGKDGFSPYFYPGAHSEQWQSLVFYRDGAWLAKNVARCPKTVELLKALPIQLRGDAMISVIKPGGTIPPHRDADNFKLTCHLAVHVPRSGDCAIRVGGEARPWQDGKAIVFDTSYEHEVWNRSNESRVVLLFDFVNTDLSEVEQRFLW
jgi:aspartate beta-hydroxylase